MRELTIRGSRCIGCMTCRNACSFVHEGQFKPSGARLEIYMDPFSGDVQGRVLPSCDLCGGKPECIRWCPVGALRYGSPREGSEDE